MKTPTNNNSSPFPLESVLCTYVDRICKVMHTKLYVINPIIKHPLDADFNIEPLSSSLHGAQHGLSPEHIMNFLNEFEQYGLSPFAEPVLDILWKISCPVHPNIALWYDSEDREEIKDLRNMISRFKNFKYKPRTTQTQNLSKEIK
ncbi:MAG: hypothetical protein WAM14_14515 [Candidatus Nitrosopolaris sp.]